MSRLLASPGEVVRNLVLFFLGATLLVACSATPPQVTDAGEPQTDSGVVDAGQPDAGPVDSSVVDAGEEDAGMPEDAGVDAGNFDFSCLGQPAPTTAPSSVTLSGTVTELTTTGASPLAGATVSFESSDAGMPLATTTSMSDGTFTLSAATDGTPIPGFLRVKKTGMVNSEFYPAQEIAADASGLSVFSVSQFTLVAIETFAGVQQDSTKGIIIASAMDCANTPVPGATLDARMNDQSVGEAWSPPSGFGDAAMIWFNVPPGEVTLRSSYGGMNFRFTVVQSRPGVLTEAAVRP